jgi:3-oxoacyl-[acyl-carrier protein] reductase
VGTATSDEGAAKISQALAGFAGSRGAKLDVNDAPAAEALIDAILREHGGLQVLVNNAGITRDALAMRLKDEDWDAVLDTNLDSVFNMSKPIVDGMVDRGWGRVINVSSVNGSKGAFGQTNYAAAKAGMHGFTKSLAREFAGRGVTANCLCPGFIATDMTHVLNDQVKEEILKKIPLGDLGSAEDIAAAVLYLASPAARYVTGQVLAVDGGMVM